MMTTVVRYLKRVGRTSAVSATVVDGRGSGQNKIDGELDLVGFGTDQVRSSDIGKIVLLAGSGLVVGNPTAAAERLIGVLSAGLAGTSSALEHPGNAKLKRMLLLPAAACCPCKPARRCPDALFATSVFIRCEQTEFN